MRKDHQRVVVFTDLDGTLLDHDTYEPGPAKDSVRRLLDRGVAVVLCSAKTRAEQVHLQSDLGIETISIVENGAAIVTPTETIASFGLDYEEVVSRLERAAADAGFSARGYGDMAPDEIGELTGLSVEAASRARDREFSVTFMVVGSAIEESSLRDALARKGLRLTKGARFWSASGDHDKGTAVRHLIDSWASSSRVLSFGVGDYHNDLEMLAEVDVPMLVQRPGGTWADLPLDGLVLLEGVGPRGWVSGARRVLAEQASLLNTG